MLDREFVKYATSIISGIDVIESTLLNYTDENGAYKEDEVYKIDLLNTIKMKLFKKLEKLVL